MMYLAQMPHAQGRNHTWAAKSREESEERVSKIMLWASRRGIVSGMTFLVVTDILRMAPKALEVIESKMS